METPTPASSGNLGAARNRELRHRYLELVAQREDATIDRTAVERQLARVGNEIAALNRGLVVSVARKYRPFGSSDFDDYVAAGLLGLWEAFCSWNPERGELSTWSYRHIEGKVRRMVAAAEFDGSYHDWCDRPAVLRAEAELAAVLGREPSPAEIATRAQVPLSVVAAAHRERPVSLEAPIGDNSTTVGDLIVSDLIDTAAPAGFDDAVIDAIAARLADVPADHVAALVRCKGLDGTALDGGPLMSLRAASRLLGVNKESLRKRVNKAAEHLH